jgi:hypothetical protein
MDPQAPNVIVPQTPPIHQTGKDNHWLSILAMAIFILFALGVVAFLYYQNQQLKQMLAGYQPAPSATPIVTTSPSPTPDPDLPVVSSPSANMTVVSPLKITGTVPAGWMFEGVFPIKLVDSNRKLIVQGQGKEKLTGSWQGGLPINFTATLSFKTTSVSGFLILQNDNPSGIPANSKTFEIPVKFPITTACTQEAKICPDGSSVGRTGPNCEFSPCP